MVKEATSPATRFKTLQKCHNTPFGDLLSLGSSKKSPRRIRLRFTRLLLFDVLNVLEERKGHEGHTPRRREGGHDLVDLGVRALRGDLIHGPECRLSCTISVAMCTVFSIQH